MSSRLSSVSCNRFISSLILYKSYCTEHQIFISLSFLLHLYRSTSLPLSLAYKQITVNSNLPRINWDPIKTTVTYQILIQSKDPLNQSKDPYRLNNIFNLTTTKQHFNLLTQH